MPDRLIDTTKLEAALQEFADARDWQQFHSPKNLAMALTGEVGELVELFQWLTEEQSRTVATDPKTANAVRDELTDVLLYTVRLASVLKVDLNAAVIDKLKANAASPPRFPGHLTQYWLHRHGLELSSSFGPSPSVFSHGGLRLGLAIQLLPTPGAPVNMTRFFVTNATWSASTSGSPN